MTFALATPDQLAAVCRLYHRAADDMEARGLTQWRWGGYPREDILAEDIAKRRLYVACEEGAPVCALVLRDDAEPEEPEYRDMDWQYGCHPVALHRLAIDPGVSGRHVGQAGFAFAVAEAARLGFDALRVDTNSQNERALRLFSANMQRRVGPVYFAFDKTMAYICFESRLAGAAADGGQKPVDAAPRSPIPMQPAFRYGESTPWGGCKLRRFFPELPDERTGEALVISAIPGLNSVDASGATLQELIDRYGETLTGPLGARAFPLLLKLIDARDKLSVQVHPGDAYAREHEGGKLGKSEAWAILQADEGASILYGMKPGVTREALQAAVDAGEALDGLIRRVPVRAGDVFSIPSGMVHAIGGGILLYEIQQSSDVTYRFWDYNRTNAKGEKRPLHLRQAMDVVDARMEGRRADLCAQTAPGLHEVLRTPAFTLLHAVPGDAPLPLPPHASSFRMITAIDGSIDLRGENGGTTALPEGQSALIPACCGALTLHGGRALIAQVG